jgi:hypothetical protein
MTPETIGVSPPEAFQRRSRLFSALSKVFAAEFVARPPGAGEGLDAVIVIGVDADPGLWPAGLPLLLLRGGEPGERGPGLIRFAQSTHLDHWLHGRTMSDERAATQPGLPPGAGAEVIATGPGGPVWQTRDIGGVVVHEAAFTPPELPGGERLKDHLRAGRFIALLPLVQFLRNLVQEGWDRPPGRACFIFDDANLHSPNYGYLDYRALAAHGRDHGYHAAIAMVPLDSGFTRGTAVECFRHEASLSLIVHGNNHTRDELGAPRGDEEALPIVARATRRILGFEAGTGLRVSRIMSPPHALVSEATMAALLRIGFEAICYWGPSDGTPRDIDGWNPADLHLGGGLPGCHRVPLDTGPDELVLRLFLDQPLLLSGHHNDLADGLDVLARSAATVNDLGVIRWPTLTGLLRQNYLCRQEADVLRVRAFARRLTLGPRPGVSRVAIEWPGNQDEAGSAVVELSGMAPDQIELGAGAIDVRLAPGGGVDPLQIAPLPLRPWPVVRRCMTEGRDRLMPLLRVGGR